MKKFTDIKSIVLILIVFGITNTYLFAQDYVYTTITKNVNKSAYSLEHKLNRSGDTLQLNSIYSIYKVEFINEIEHQVFQFEKQKNRVSIALQSLPIGDYTVALYHIERNDEVYQYQKTIIFRISRLLPIPNTTEAVLVAANKTEETTNHTQNMVNNVAEEAEDLAEINLDPENIQIADQVGLNHKDVRLKIKATKATSKITKTKAETEDLKPYNISSIRNNDYAIQTRAAYRRNNLRPNGKPYD